MGREDGGGRAGKILDLDEKEKKGDDGKEKDFR